MELTEKEFLTNLTKWLAEWYAVKTRDFDTVENEQLMSSFLAIFVLGLEAPEKIEGVFNAPGFKVAYSFIPRHIHFCTPDLETVKRAHCHMSDPVLFLDNLAYFGLTDRFVALYIPAQHRILLRRPGMSMIGWIDLATGERSEELEKEGPVS